MRRFRSASLLAIALVVAGLGSRAPLRAEPTLDVTLDPKSVTVGDRIAAELVVRVDAGDGRTPTFPDWSRGWGKLDVISAAPPERVAGPNGDVWRQRLALAAFEPGKLELPAVEVALDGDPDLRLATPAGIAIEVRSVLPPGTEEVEPMPPDPPRRLPLPAAFWWTAGALAAAGVALAVAAARRRTRRSGSLAALSPFAELERALAEIARDEPAPALTRLSSALRRYLGRSLSLRALESTTSELAQRLAGGLLDRALIQNAVRLLREIDQVKFARRAADGAELARRIDDARTLVREVEKLLHPPAPPASTVPAAAPGEKSAA